MRHLIGRRNYPLPWVEVTREVWGSGMGDGMVFRQWWGTSALDA
jgi:hypothetical protein